jgi:hypothetical protein
MLQELKHIVCMVSIALEHGQRGEHLQPSVVEGKIYQLLHLTEWRRGSRRGLLQNHVRSESIY